MAYILVVQFMKVSEKLSLRNTENIGNKLITRNDKVPDKHENFE